jgi:hypothetical protein
MIVSELFEEIPYASGMINPNTGRPWLPSEINAAYDAEHKIEQAKADAAATAAEEEAKAEREAAAAEVAKYPTSSTAPAPSSVKYTGALAPTQKKATPNFTKTSFAGYKMPGTPSVPTVPNITSAPAKPVPAKTTPAPATSQEPMKIGGQALNPSDPADAKIIAQVQQQQGTQSSTAIPTVNTGIQDVINRLNSQIKTIKNRDDLKKIKQNIDREFTRKGVVTESAFVKRDILIKRANAKLAQVLK